MNEYQEEGRQLLIDALLRLNGKVGPVFRYPDIYWEYIKEKCSDHIELKRDEIEKIIHPYVIWPKSNFVRNKLNQEISIIKDIVEAGDRFLNQLDKWDWTTRRFSNEYNTISTMISVLKKDIEETQSAMPPNRGDRSKSLMLSRLWDYWRQYHKEGSATRAYSDERSKELETPGVQFIKVVTEPILDEPLTTGAATYAYRNPVRIDREK